MRIKCHWHYNQRRYSVSMYDKEKKGWRVVRDDRGEQVFYGKLILKNAEFKVSQAGRKRAVEQGVRNVHAFVEGEFLQGTYTPTPPSVPCGVEVKYSPFNKHFNTFYVEDTPSGWPIFEAGIVSLGIDTKPLTNKYYPVMIARV
jgi:hypothetical protein